MTTREEKCALLKPLVDLMCTSHCWRNHRHIDEPFTEVMLSEHVMGGARYGLCPIAPGESTTRVALLDFDSHDGLVEWSDMLRTAQTVQTALELEGYAPVLLFRSSGGRGIHIILTWAAPQDAHSVREMLHEVLASCGFKSGTGGVAKNEIEVFPKQSSVPLDGCGSMFVLPFAGKSERIAD